MESFFLFVFCFVFYIGPVVSDCFSPQVYVFVIAVMCWDLAFFAVSAFERDCAYVSMNILVYTHV